MVASVQKEELWFEFAKPTRIVAGAPDVMKAAFTKETDFFAERNFARLEPYLEATARKHPTLAAPLMTLSRETLATKRALVHGDVSPKNILAGPAGPVFLDAECAWYGDPAFDLAFCLNHLLLKAVWNRRAAQDLLDAFDALQAAYLARVGWEPPEAVEARAARLLAALFLARVDGKSPVDAVRDLMEREPRMEHPDLGG